MKPKLMLKHSMYGMQKMVIYAFFMHGNNWSYAHSTSQRKEKDCRGYESFLISNICTACNANPVCVIHYIKNTYIYIFLVLSNKLLFNYSYLIFNVLIFFNY